ncbi:hypothetical protein B0H10DRAFT_1954232 [Mycena sp. CBHHK59/15]|nr:hypothetical protein B0H10DRAFT_1954232 [Mycena sp. CBHHK59/15]
MTLTDMERFKHMVSSGWWKGQGGEYTQAGRCIRSFLASNRELQHRLGWSEKSGLESGTIKLQAFKKRTPAIWDPTSELVEPAPLESSWNSMTVSCKCTIETVQTRQEQIVIERTELQTVHSEARFILNTHAFNAHLIQEVLPQTLTAPVPYLNDRTAARNRFASQLSEMGPAKHAETKAKTQATRVRNRTNKEAMTSAQEKRQREENDLESKSDPEEGDGENENGKNGGDAMELDG